MRLVTCMRPARVLPKSMSTACAAVPLTVTLLPSHRPRAYPCRIHGQEHADGICSVALTSLETAAISLCPTMVLSDSE